jgi:hypothetical protein
MFLSVPHKHDFSVLRYLQSSQSSISDDDEEPVDDDWASICTGPPPPGFWHFIRSQNNDTDEVAKVIANCGPLNSPMDLALLLCKLITVAPVITGYVKIFVRIPEALSFDISPAFNPAVFSRLIAEFFQHGIRTKRRILKVLEKGIPVDRRTEAHDALFCFISAVIAWANPGKIASTALVVLEQLIPYEVDAGRATALLHSAYRKFCHEVREMTILLSIFQLFLSEHRSYLLFTSPIATALLRSFSERFCVQSILALFESINRLSELNATALIEAGMIPMLFDCNANTSDFEIQRMCMIVITSLPEYAFRAAVVENSDILACIKLAIDDAPIPAKLRAALAYLRALQLMKMDGRAIDATEDRITTMLELLLCGSSGEIIDITTGIYFLVIDDEELQSHVFTLSIWDTLSELSCSQISSEAAHALEIFMNVFSRSIDRSLDPRK